MENKIKELLIDLLLQETAGAGETLFKPISLAIDIYCELNNKKPEEIKETLKTLYNLSWGEYFNGTLPNTIEVIRKCQEAYAKLLNTLIK